MKKQGYGSTDVKVQMSRRTLLKSAAIAAAAPLLAGRAHASERRIVIRTSGGDLTQSYEEHVVRPFTEKTGIQVTQITSGPTPLNMIKGMVDTKSYSWDMAEISLLSSLALSDQYLEPLNIDNDPDIAAVPAHMRTALYIPMYLYASVFAYREDRLKGDGIPKNWAEFYDIKKFPARRSLRRAALDTFESALLADGVSGDALYPLDGDRALKKLDTVKNDIAIWWETGSQSTHLLASGEVDLIATWSQRVNTAIKGGTPAKIVWKDGYYATAGWGILKGAPKADMCREFIKFATNPERQAAFAVKPSVGPVHPKAFDYIPKEIMASLPTYPENFQQLIPVDAAFWGKNRSALEAKFDAWLLSK